MTSPNNDPNYDPLAAAQKRQSVSFKRHTKGQRKVLRVESMSREAQQADYDTGKPAFWPSDTPGVNGNPKMAVVFDVFDEDESEPRALWCAKPSSMLNAIAKAQSVAGTRIAPGGQLEVWIDDYKKSNDPKKEDQKLYAAVYTPPAPADPLASSAPASESISSDGIRRGGQPVASDEPPF